MERNALTNEIFAYGKNVFRALHNQYGFDFEAPHVIFRIDGCFTVSAVRKQAYQMGAAYGATFAILYTGGIYYKLHAVSLYENSCEVRVVGNDRMKLENSYFNTAYVSDFTKARKNVNTVAYVIFQNKEHVKFRNYDWTVGWTKRFKLIDPCEGWWYDDTLSANVLIDENGVKWENYRSYGFDKSGYCVSERRRDLARRADDVRAARRKAEIDHADVVAKALAIDAAITARKAELVNMLISANSIRDIANVSKALGTKTWEDSFVRALSLAEDFKRHLENDSFSSVSDVNSLYNSVMHNLSKC